MPKKPKGIKFLTRCRLALNHLRQHVFKQSFQDTVNPICRCSNDIETTVNYLLHYYYCNEKLTSLKKRLLALILKSAKHSFLVKDLWMSISWMGYSSVFFTFIMVSLKKIFKGIVAHKKLNWALIFVVVVAFFDMLLVARSQTTY